MATSAIKADQVTVTYPHAQQPAIQDISFQIEPQSVVMIIGPNGSGKSTLVKALLGIVPYKGDISFFDQSLATLNQDIGYVPQRFSLPALAPITVSEFMKLALANSKLAAAEQHQMITAALAKVGLDGKENELVLELSGGQLQRLLLARALVHQPRILILDEPEAGIDIAGEQTIFSLLKQLAEDEMTIIIVSHELSLVSSLADQVICINKTLVCAGAPQVLDDSQTMEKLYPHGVHGYHHLHGDHDHV